MILLFLFDAASSATAAAPTFATAALADAFRMKLRLCASAAIHQNWLLGAAAFALCLLPAVRCLLMLVLLVLLLLLASRYLAGTCKSGCCSATM